MRDLDSRALKSVLVQIRPAALWYLRKMTGNDQIETERRCVTCERTLNLKSFAKTTSGHRERKCSTCRSRARYKANPERCREERRNWRRNNVASAIVIDSRKADKRRDLAGNDMTTAWVAQLIAQPCRYCDETLLRMTLDRLDNALPHIKTNVVPCCIRCNYIRGSMPYAAWLLIAPAVREVRKKGLFGDWRAQPFNRKSRISTDQVVP